MNTGAGDCSRRALRDAKAIPEPAATGIMAIMARHGDPRPARAQSLTITAFAIHNHDRTKNTHRARSGRRSGLRSISPASSCRARGCTPRSACSTPSWHRASVWGRDCVRTEHVHAIGARETASGHRPQLRPRSRRSAAPQSGPQCCVFCVWYAAKWCDRRMRTLSPVPAFTTYVPTK